MQRKTLTFAIVITLTSILAFGTVVSNAFADKVLIGFTTQPGPNEEALVRGLGGKIKYTYRIVPAISADVPGLAIARLRANRMVTHVHPDLKVRALDTELDNSWGVKHIDAGVVHSYNKGTGVKIAVVDSGIDYSHSDLDANYAGGYDFVNSDSDPVDDNGHGTHVAGTVAAEDNDSGVVGVAPEASLYALKVLDSGGSGNWSDVIAAIEWAADPNGDEDTSDHLDVTNLSLGSDSDPGSTVKSAFDNAYQIGVLHVAAAGNSGNPPGKGDNVGYPARYDSVIAVAATDKNDKRARWSSTGDSKSTTVTVNEQSTGNENDIYVSDTAFSEKHYGKGGSKTDLMTTVTIWRDADADGTSNSSGDEPVSNAHVSMTLTHDTDGDGTFEPGTDDDSWNFGGDTDSEGKVTFTLKFASNGNYKAEVTDVTHDTYVYNASLDADNPDYHTVGSTSSATALLNNYPEPFNPDTWIPFKQADQAHVVIKIYNVTGKLIRKLDLGLKPSGVYTSRSKAAYWDGRNRYGERVSSGIYFYKMEAGRFSAIKKMVIMK